MLFCVLPASGVASLPRRHRSYTMAQLELVSTPRSEIVQTILPVSRLVPSEVGRVMARKMLDKGDFAAQTPGHPFEAIGTAQK